MIIRYVLSFFLFFLACSSTQATDLRFYFNSSENAPIADWLFFYPEPVSRLVNVEPEMYLNFQIVDVNSMMGIEGFYYLPTYVKTNVFGFWITPTLNSYTLNNESFPLFKINEMPAYITNWNSLSYPLSGKIINLKVPNQGPGLYSLYIIATNNSSNIFGNISGARSFERYTIEVVDPGVACEELEEAKRNISSPEDIQKFYIQNKYYYKGSLECCLEGCQDACLAKSPCATLKKKYGMCQDFTALNSVLISHLGLPNKPVTLSQETEPGHAVLVFLYKNAFYMFDNMLLKGPANTLKQLLDMNGGAPSWNGFYVLDNWYKLMEGRFYGPYRPKSEANFISTKEFFQK